MINKHLKLYTPTTIYVTIVTYSVDCQSRLLQQLGMTRICNIIGSDENFKFYLIEVIGKVIVVITWTLKCMYGCIVVFTTQNV